MAPNSEFLFLTDLFLLKGITPVDIDFDRLKRRRVHLNWKR